VTQRDAHIVDLNADVTQRDAHIVDLNAVIAEYQNATSWKVTAPLRWLAHQSKRMQHLLRIAPQLTMQAGGMKSALLKLYKLILSEGMSGVKHRLKNHVGSPIIIGSTHEKTGRNDYAQWLSHYDIATDHQHDLICKRIEDMAYLPLISIIMPTYNPNPIWLQEAIESVANQSYTSWELCIADDASTNPEIRTLLEKYVAEDKRIKVIFRTVNGHISAASNSALELATGDWVALLDHDDLLSEHALYWVANAINDNPEIKLIYSDEDKVAESGNRISPYFKTDWNPDLFLSHNHICHLGVYNHSLIKSIQGFRKGVEGAQDYDLALRCIEQINADNIHHIPRILYHWRMHKGSTALAGSEKNYALIAGKKALDEHFQRCAIKATAELLECGMYRVHYELPVSLPLVSIVIPTYNGLSILKQCIDSILTKTTYPNYEIIVIDNNSDDKRTLEYLERIGVDENIRVLKDPRPFNYSQLNNAAIEKSKGQYVLLMNNDIEVITPDWLSEMVSIVIQEGVGCVGARLWYPNDTLQHGGVIIGLGGVAGHSHKHLPRKSPGYFWRAQLIQNFSAVTAACLIVRKSIFDEVGGLNEDKLQVAFNDVDLCLKVREAGYRNVWTPYAELYHHESATRGYEDTPEKKQRFSEEVQYMKEQWGQTLMNDPAYSPNLTLDYEDFSLAWPPRL